MFKVEIETELGLGEKQEQDKNSKINKEDKIKMILLISETNKKRRR